ncbi:hypothetical protein BH11ACT8_BH11ACT8_35240 [soil metagenome]
MVVFHEQVIQMISELTGISYAEGDEKRRALGDTEGMAQTRLWFHPRALGRGYPLAFVEPVWKVIEAFASFGFCQAHAAAFALPTYQSAWLKTHWPAHFLAGVLTHDPGMYPKRLILDDVRRLGIEVLGLDVNASEKAFVVESASTERLGGSPGGGAPRAYGIRLALSEVKGINAGEVERIVAARPYSSLTDFWHRARVSRPVVERLILAGGFDSTYGLGTRGHHDTVRPRGRVTRRDLLLQAAELERFGKALDRAQGHGRGWVLTRSAGVLPAATRAAEAVLRNSTDPAARDTVADLERHPLGREGVWARAAAQSRATAAPLPVSSVQLALDLGDGPREGEVSGLPEMSAAESMAAELEILGLDVSRHVIDGYARFLDELGTTRSRDLLQQRSRSELLVAGVKVATQTPPIRSGRRVVFLTLDDSTGPVDATFFEDAQGPYAQTVFGSWLLVVRGELRRTGHRGVSLRATGAWELSALHALWRREGIDAVHDHLAVVQAGTGEEPQQRRVLVHTSGFQMSPYSDIKPAGEDPKDVARKLWHRSPGSPG